MAGNDSPLEEQIEVARRKHEAGDTAGAIDACSGVLASFPDSIEALNWRAYLLQKVGRTLDSLQDLDKAISLAPRHVDFRVLRGNALSAKGDLEGALADYSLAIELEPSNEEARFGRALVRSKQGNLASAIEECSQAIRVKPTAVAYLHRGCYRERSGEWEGAILDYDEAIRIDPLYHDAWFNRGMLKARRDRFSHAATDFTEAIRISPVATNYLYRAMVLEDSGDPRGAHHDFIQALRLDPENKEAQAGRDRVELKLRNHFEES